MHVKSLLAAAGTMAAVATAATGVAGAHPLVRPGVVTAGGDVVSASPGTPTTYEAGYAVATPATATLTTDVTVPTLTCTSASTQPDFVTIGLYGSDDSGNFQESGGILVLSCQSGDTLSNVVDDQLANGVAVSPGDQIQVSVSASPSETYTDVTTGATSSATGNGFSVNGSQTTMQGAYGNAASRSGFPKFTPTHFSGVTIDGMTLAATAPNRYYQVGQTGKKQIVASAIKQQSNFTGTWIGG